MLVLRVVFVAEFRHGATVQDVASPPLIIYAAGAVTGLAMI